MILQVALDLDLGSLSDLSLLGLDQFKSSKDILDLDLQQLTNEVDGLESLADQMETLTFSDMVDDGLFLGQESKRKPLKRQKGGRRKKKQAKHHKKQMMSLPAKDSSVTLCQLMNICDTVPMGSTTIEEKSHLMPFASSLRSELVVDAPDSLTSDTNIDIVTATMDDEKNTTAVKAVRMEDVIFSQGSTGTSSPHREIDFNQGIPVTASLRLEDTNMPR